MNEYFLCGSLFPDKVIGSKRRKKKVKPKIKTCIDKSKTKKKKKESCTVGKGSDEGKK